MNSTKWIHKLLEESEKQYQEGKGVDYEIIIKQSLAKYSK
jgi:hypothetical protein